MRRILALLFVIMLILPTCATAIGGAVDLNALSDDELLSLWQAAGERLKEIGAYPYIELSKGDSGTDVTNLQHRLSELYYYTADLTGKFDNNTIKAVKAFEKAHDIKADGIMSIDEQDLLYSRKALAKPTPTPTPSPTPAPTPIPANAVIEITSVSLRDYYNTKVFSLKLKNHSKDITIDAFTVTFRCFDGYGETLTKTNQSAEWWKELTLKPGKSFSMGSYFWYLFTEQTCAKIDVAISKYHTTDGQTIEIDESDYIWVSGEL